MPQRGHKEAQRSRLQFSKSPIDGPTHQAIEDEENKCAAIVSRVIDVLLACADMDIGLRGHREKIRDGKCEGGNFLAMIKLLSQYDPLLKEIINSPKTPRDISVRQSKMSCWVSWERSVEDHQ